MALLEKKPPHVRRKIALFWTLAVAIILVVVLIIVYTAPQDTEEVDTPSKFDDFYKTISDRSQSFFDGK